MRDYTALEQRIPVQQPTPAGKLYIYIYMNCLQAV